jgi:nitrile hydratase
MNAAHSSADLGGQSFGPVPGIHDEKSFHHAWESRVMAMAVAMGPTGQWTLDHTRARRESIPRERYLSNPYYQTWFEALCALLLERGLVTPAELQQGLSLLPGRQGINHLPAARVDQVLAAGSPTWRPSTTTPRFQIGQSVRVRADWSKGHTRAPAYVHGKQGSIVAVHGTHILPDRRSAKLTAPFDEAPEWLYTVEFSSTELWPDDAEQNFKVSVDAFEPYLSDTGSPS